GYGFFAHFGTLDLDAAWRTFGWKNGDPVERAFRSRIGEYRRADLSDRATVHAPLGCTVLRDAHFWPEERWMPWGTAQGWERNIVRGKTEDDAVRAQALLSRIAEDGAMAAIAEEFAPSFSLVEADERRLAQALTVV